MLKRRVTFLAKAEYFTGTGVKGRAKALFFRSAGQLPVDRSGGKASEAALRSGLRVLRRGDLLGIYPEGTRSPDARLYRGKTGVAKMALESRVPRGPRRHGRHREGPADRAQAAEHPPRRHRHRPPARLLPLRRDGRRPPRPALGDRRDHVRAHAPVRPGVRRRVRGRGQGADRGREARPRRRRRPRHGRAAHRPRHLPAVRAAVRRRPVARGLHVGPRRRRGDDGPDDASPDGSDLALADPAPDEAAATLPEDGPAADEQPGPRTAS